MKKEVFTQEFEKCFTVFQQVQLMKKYLSEILDEIPEPDLSGSLQVKKVASGTYVNSENEREKIFRFTNILKEYNFYYLTLYDDNSGSLSSCIFCTNEASEEYGLTLIPIVNIEDNFIDGRVYISNQNDYTKVTIQSINDAAISKSENDELEIYEIPFTLSFSS